MPACSPFRIPPPAAAVPSRARARKHAHPVSAPSCSSGGIRSLLPVAVAVMMMMASAAFGVARAQGTWSTAQLSVARGSLAAASVGNVVLFAGGNTASTLLFRVWGGDVYGCACVERLRVLQYYGYVSPATACSLIRATADGSSNVVDVYNSATGAWSTAQLSVARGFLAAASVGNVALFAGGNLVIAASALLFREGS